MKLRLISEYFFVVLTFMSNLSLCPPQAKLAFERLDVPKIYHPFVCGPDNNVVNDLMAKTGAQIRVPPPSVDKNEIIVSGEKEGVAMAVDTIMKIYKDKVRDGLDYHGAAILTLNKD